jgi:hypothetical protein
LVERQFITILFAIVNVSCFVKVGMKLLHIETLVTRNAIWEISLNMQDLTSVRLGTLYELQVPNFNVTSIWRSGSMKTERRGVKM